jgi:hypothetical protein
VNLTPKGTLSGMGDETSFARYAGILMVFAIIILVFAMAAMLALMDLCNPALIGTEIHEVCEKRFSPGNLAAFMTAAGATFGGTTVFLYRANKQAEQNGA